MHHCSRYYGCYNTITDVRYGKIWKYVRKNEMRHIIPTEHDLVNGVIQMPTVRKHDSNIERIMAACMAMMLVSGLICDRKAQAQDMAPYCPIPVFEVPFHPWGGQATIDMSGRPVILIDPTLVQRIPFPHGQNFHRFLLAHECMHHLKGHIINLAPAGVFAGYILMRMSHTLEMEADCEAARELSRRGDSSAVESAIWVFMNSNPFPTHSHPGGPVRAHNIGQCARR